MLTVSFAFATLPILLRAGAPPDPRHPCKILAAAAEATRKA